LPRAKLGWEYNYLEEKILAARQKGDLGTTKPLIHMFRIRGLIIRQTSEIKIFKEDH